MEGKARALDASNAQRMYVKKPTPTLKYKVPMIKLDKSYENNE